jgi:citronellol/citronellal dehydrogenase
VICAVNGACVSGALEIALSCSFIVASDRAGIAERLAADGADVALVARTLEKHKSLPGSRRDTQRACEAYGARAMCVVADLTDEQSRSRVIPTAVEQLGGNIYILVNNAAASIAVRIAFECNIIAPLHLSQRVIPGMRAAGAGWIVNLTSTGRDCTMGRRSTSGRKGR